jgi:hypothetical protein
LRGKLKHLLAQNLWGLAVTHSICLSYRFVLEMALKETRVKDKKGKVILVLSAAVRDLVNGIAQFAEQLQKID